MCVCVLTIPPRTKSKSSMSTTIMFGLAVDELLLLLLGVTILGQKLKIKRIFMKASLFILVFFCQR